MSPTYAARDFTLRYASKIWRQLETPATSIILSAVSHFETARLRLKSGLRAI